ncbi:MAG: hypothetical protein H6721_03680 [Sandaracinus sp.]|nr:hypothetical protein [Sandaracinus sp.]MCB9631234.1 hypothetical protein [Sandaracinus sp.]
MKLRLGLLLLLAACGASNATARRFGGAAMDCPEQDVEAEMLVHDVFEVTGCGRSVVVHCHGREVCEAVEPGQVPEAPRAVAPMMDSEESSESLASPREREGSSPPSR